MLDLRAHFSRFLAAEPGRIHLAAHSHHYWPDVTREAQIAAWDDAARLADAKWGHMMGPVWREAQTHVARVLSLPDPGSVVFGQNTFEFWLRLISCFPAQKRLRILASDGEFHSFTRLARRLEEDGLVTVEHVPAEPFADFAQRFAERAAEGGHDIVLFSQVLFNSGFALSGEEMARIVSAVPSRESFIVIDGYHGFMAVPTDLSGLAERVFYMSGGYKYVMSGEGAAFMHCPPGFGPRPRATGWYAAFAALEASQDGAVGYAEDGYRFMGATFDPSALYRFNAVMRWLEGLGISVEAIHAHAHALHRVFVGELESRGAALREADLLLPLAHDQRGNFLTFRRTDAQDLHARLAAGKVVTDVRGDRLRVGFGIYHAEEDALKAGEAVAALLRD